MSASTLPSRFAVVTGINSLITVGDYNRIRSFVAQGNGSTQFVSNFSSAATIASSTAARNFANTNLVTRQSRIGALSTATAGTVASVRSTTASFYMAQEAKYVFTFAMSDAATVANARCFVGLSVTGISTTTSPQTLTNIIGVGSETGDTNLSVYCNDGSGTATKTALGSNFPANTLSADLYKLTLLITGVGTSVAYVLENATNGNTASGTLTTDIPAAGTALYFNFFRDNATTALQVGIDVMSLFVYSPY